MIRQKFPYIAVSKETFTQIILKLQLVSMKQGNLYNSGLDVTNFTDDYHNIITTLLKSIFNEEQLGWIEWFLYERPSFKNEPLSAYKTLDDGTKVEICYDIDSLWELLKEIEMKNIVESMDLSRQEQ